MGFKDLFIEKDQDTDELDMDLLSAGLQGTAGDNSMQLNVREVDINDLPELEPVDMGEEILNTAYEANNLDDLSQSIYKVEELRNALPKEMPNNTKRSTVTTIMSSFNLTPDDVINDSVKRSNILSQTLEKNVDTLTNSNNELSAQIEELKTQIQRKEVEIAANQDIIQSVTTKINAELTRIDNLVKFIKGE